MTSWVGTWRRRSAVVGALLAAAATAAVLGANAWARSHVRAAEAALAEFRYDEARRHLDLALKVRPGDADILVKAAHAARRAGDRTAAGRLLGECERRHGLTPAVARE